MTLAQVPEEKVKKDIERGWVVPRREALGNSTRLLFFWHDVVSIAAAYHNNILGSRARSKIVSLWHENVMRGDNPTCAHRRIDHASMRVNDDIDRVITIDKYLSVDMGKVMDDVWPRVELYGRGLARIESSENVLAGDWVFKGSRLPVKHVGGMVEAGEPAGLILEDYPYLTDEDVRFAHLYYLAHPTVGRPRAKRETGHAAPSVA